MKPDFEKMSERMEQASLKEFLPGFDKEQEWQQLSRQLHPVKQRKLITLWSYAAAILLLLASGSWLAWSLSGTHTQHIAAQQNTVPAQNMPAISAPNQAVVPMSNTPSTNKQNVARNDDHGNGTKITREKNTVTIRRNPGHKAANMINTYRTKDFVCNGTPCPIQICISQTIKCPNIEPAAISSCSTLEPDQSGQLRYKAHDKIAKNCSLTINEIEITSIATGETILLNASSTPSTAQEVFSYITGQKKGDILAGMFNSDCNHQTKKHGLKINNSYGDLIIE